MDGKDLPWHLLQSFVACAEHGSLSGAARQTGATQPTLSRHVGELEALVQGRLFRRSRQGLDLTPRGLELIGPAKAMADAAALASAQLSGQTSQEIRTVRLTASRVIATFWVPDLLVEFQANHPNIQVELVASDRTENLLRREADIALRMFRPTQDGLIARHLDDFEIAMLSSEAYLSKYGAPENPADLKDHRLVGMDQDTLLIDGIREFGLDIGPEDFDLRCDDQVTLMHLIARGGGIGFGQARLVERLPDLIALPIEGGSPPVLPLWLTSHASLNTNQAVRLLFDFLADRLKRS